MWMANDPTDPRRGDTLIGPDGARKIFVRREYVEVGPMGTHTKSIGHVLDNATGKPEQIAWADLRWPDTGGVN